MKNIYKCAMATAIISLMGFANLPVHESQAKWSIKQTNEWQKKYGWLRGCNFIPSTAINQLEMWQYETFDTATINKELSWANEIGLNMMRVFLHHKVWEQDPDGFKKRIETYLAISKKNNIFTMFVFFDDCWAKTAAIGKQPVPRAGIHNSGWLQDPGQRESSDTLYFSKLEIYVKDIMNSFANDKRIILWDLYNEPGNTSKGDSSMHLLKRVFRWARETKVKQPITVGVWSDRYPNLNKVQLENSDIISYHNYNKEESQLAQISYLKHYNRPIICSEYMARTKGSLFQTIMPLLKKENVGAINWGFVSGKTNTIFEWNDKSHTDGSEPTLWFHDIYRKDKTAFSVDEINVIKKLCSE